MQPPSHTRAPHDVAPLAPRWHTAALVALFVSVAALGALSQRAGAAVTPPSRVWGYLSAVVVQWALAVYAWRVGRPRGALRALVGVGWRTPSRALGDLALAAIAWALIETAELAWARVAAPSAVTAMLPHTTPERLTWVVFAVSAGFCEEVVFRGYLQTQLTAWCRSAAVAIALQAALFGVAHGEQGLVAVARVGAYGLLFGALARWRRSLVPGIVAHVWTDLASGLLRA